MHSNLYTIGSEAIPLLVIDDAVPEAKTFRNYAIESCKEVFEEGLYPGFRCKTMPEYNRFLIELINHEIKQAVSKFDAQFTPMQLASSYFSMVTKHPSELSLAQRIPHYDRPESGQLAVVHYLCDESHGGTSFYRHKTSGFEIVNPEREPKYLATLEKECLLAPPEAQYLSSDTPLFSLYHRVDAKFNRLIVYPSNCLHSGNIKQNFIPTMNPYEGRFTVTAFLE
jgi:hypothetical protein